MRMDCVGTRVLVNNRKMNTSQKRRVHATFGALEGTKVSLGLFLLVTLATNIKIPEHQTNPNSTLKEQVMNRYHGVNELYDGTIN